MAEVKEPTVNGEVDGNLESSSSSSSNELVERPADGEVILL